MPMGVIYWTMFWIDIAVGAPYEDKKGAVYIYHGSRSGLKTNYAQVSLNS